MIKEKKNVHNLHSQEAGNSIMILQESTKLLIFSYTLFPRKFNSLKLNFKKHQKKYELLTQIG